MVAGGVSLLPLQAVRVHHPQRKMLIFYVQNPAIQYVLVGKMVRK